MNALLKVFYSFKATDVLEEIKVAVGVNASANESVPVNTLKLDISVVLLKAKVQSLSEVDVRTFDCVHVLASHFKLVEIEVLWEYLHYDY